jgi:hypothetical protein
MSLIQRMSVTNLLVVGLLYLLSNTSAFSFSRDAGINCVREHYQLGPSVADATGISPEQGSPGDNDLLGIAEDKAEADVEQIAIRIGILLR